MRTTNRMRTLALLGLSAFIITALHSVAVGLPTDLVQADFASCNDGLDNDLDGQIDYPEDPECTSIHDESEGPTHDGLFLSVSDGLDEVKAGGSTTYTIALRSDRSEPKTVDVQFFLPHQTNMLSSSAGGARQGEYVVWKNVTVYPRVVRELFVNVQVNPHSKQELLLVAEVRSDGTKAVDTTRVIDTLPGPPLRIIVNDGKEFAKPSDQLVYKVAVRNESGPDRNYNLRVQMPKQLEFVGSEGNFVYQNNVLIWSDQFLKANESREYSVIAKVDREAEDFELIRMVASSDAASAADLTTVRLGLGATSFDLHVSDGQDVTSPGEELHYEITLYNNENVLATEIDINNQLPVYTEFVSATEGGYWTGKNVRWTGLTVSPHGQRTLHVTARVRSDAPLNAALRNTVLAEGNQAVDITDVVEMAAKAPRYMNTHRPALLRKMADRSVVQPGDVVGYTVVFSNTTSTPFTNVIIEDRLDTRYMTVLGAEQGALSGDRLTWNIPVLQPGEEWRVHYTVSIAQHTPHGVELANVVSVRGDGLDLISLTERIQTTQLGVVTDLPPTGAAFDIFFLGLTGLLGAGQTLAQRRKYLV